MDTENIKILAIDDNLDNLITIQALISDAFPNAKTILSTRGKEGLLLASKENPDVILLDVVMPEMDGFETCQNLKAEIVTADIPIVFVTALKGDKETRIKCLEVGGDAFLSKPIDESELVAQIRAMVKVRRAKINQLTENERLAKLVAEKTSELTAIHTATLNMMEDLQKEIEIRKKTEDALRESEGKFRDMANLLPQVVFELDLEGKLTYINQQALNLFRFTDENTLGIHVSNFFVPEEINRVQESCKLTLNGITPHNIEYQLLRKDGTSFPAIVSSNLIIKNGKTVGLRGVITDISVQKHSEKVLRENELFLKETQQIARVGSYSLDIIEDKWSSSDVLDAIFGIDPDFEKTTLSWNSIIHPDWQKPMLEYFIQDVIGKKHRFDKTYLIIRQNDKAERWVHGVGELRFDANSQPIKMIGSIQDITEKQQSDDNIKHLARLYAFQSQINQAIIKSKNRQELFDTICSVAIDYGNFRMCWIGISNPETKTLEPIASAGYVDGYLDNFRITVADDNNELAKGPTGRAFRERKEVFCNNISTDPMMLPWKQNALNRGYFSSFSTPVCINDKPIGTLTLYASETNFFKDDEQKLLIEIAENISFALDVFETETKRKLAEISLENSRNELKTIYDFAPVMMCVLDDTAKITFANKAINKLITAPVDPFNMGRPGNVIGCLNALTDPRGCTYGKNCEKCVLRNAILDTIKTGKVHQNIEYSSKLQEGQDTKEISLLASTALIKQGDRKSVLLCFHDITHRKHTEEALRKSETLLRSIIDNSPFEIWARDEHNIGILENRQLINNFGTILGIPIQTDPRINKADAKRWVEANRLAYAGKVINEEIEYIINNERHHLQQIIFPIKDEEITLGVVGFNIDITEQKKASISLKESQQDLKKFANHLQTIREGERVNLAREIHDDLGQILIAIKIDLGLLKNSIKKSLPDKISSSFISKFDSLAALVDDTLASARRIMTDLRPEVLDLIGFVETVTQYLGAFEKRTKISCELQIEVESTRLTSSQAVALFRIVQEAMNNIAKHALCSKVNLSLTRKNDNLILEIVDNGVGFDSNKVSRTDSYGLMGMKERVYLLEGELIIKSEIGKGTTIKVIIPQNK